MAIEGSNTNWDWYGQHDQARQEFAESLVRMSEDDLVNLALESYPKVGYVDLIIQELSFRTMACKDEVTLKAANDLIEYIKQIRERMLELLNAGDSLSRQTIAPEEVTFIDNEGCEHKLRFSAFELANTGEMTSEGRVRAALRANGITATVSQRTYVDGTGVSEWRAVFNDRRPLSTHLDSTAGIDTIQLP